MNCYILRRCQVVLMILCLIIGQGSLVTARAQEPDEKEIPIVVAPSGQLNLTFEQRGYETIELYPGRVGRSFTLDLPGNFQISPTGNTLDLIASHLPETPDKPSLLQIRVNGQLMSTLPLTSGNAISSTTRLQLPEKTLQPGQNSIRFVLNTGDTCEEPGGFVNVLIDKNTTLNFEYEQIPYLADLGLYPFPFTEESLLNISTTIVLPDQPTSADLSAAAVVAAGLGQMSGGNANLTVVLAGNLTTDIRNNNHLIVVGRPDTQDVLNNFSLPLPIDQTTLEPGQGVLQEIISPWNEFRLILVISGLDDEGVLKASHALNRQAHFLGMRGPVAVVVELGSLSETDTARTSSFTLASLNYEDQVFYGTEAQDYAFEFYLPLGWQLEENPFLLLKFAHANLISSESVIDVVLNGTPIASTLLNENNADEGELYIALPGRRLRTGLNRLSVGVEMKLPDTDRCEGLGNKRAWTVINSESEIFLPYNEIELPVDLNLLPYPFSQIDDFDQTIFLVPDQPSPQIFDQLIQLAVWLGSATTTENISVQVKYATELDHILRKKGHLILLGRPTKNEQIRDINAYLPQPFIPDSDFLEPFVLDNVAFLPDSNRDAGLLQLIQSPWNEKYSLLAITGTTDEGVRLAVKTLSEQIDDLKGNLAVVEPIYDPFSDEPNQLSIYSLDTRSSMPINQTLSSANNTFSEKDLSTLANRWWK